jgi:hypothetical protein
MLQQKSTYLNVPFFVVRAVIYFSVWLILTYFLNRWSAEQDEGADVERRLEYVSRGGLLLFTLTMTFASIDWVMSLEPHWYSTIYGVYWFAGSLVGVFATLILISMALTRSGVLRQVITIEHFHDLGKLLYTFMVFWTYIGFSQFFLIWYADLPEETFWYLKRLDSGWKTLTIALAIGHFAVPFFFLMSEHVKRRRVLLAAGASWMLLMHLLDMYWLVMPGFLEQGPDLRPLDLLILIGFVALSLAAFGLVLGRQALVPSRDPRLVESMGFENV